MRGWSLCVPLVTRKMSVHSLRIRSTQGSSSNMMEWLIPLKNSLTNFPITRTTDAYNPMMLQETGGTGTGRRDGDRKEEEVVDDGEHMKTIAPTVRKSFQQLHIYM